MTMIARAATWISLVLLVAVMVAWGASCSRELTWDCMLPGRVFFLADALDGHLMIWIIPDVEPDEAFQETRNTIRSEGLGDIGRQWRMPSLYYESPCEWRVDNIYLLLCSDYHKTQALGMPLWMPAAMLMMLPAIRFVCMPLRARRRRGHRPLEGPSRPLAGSQAGPFRAGQPALPPPSPEPVSTGFTQP